MKKTSLNRLLVLVILLLSSIVTSWAGGGGETTYYYAKVTAHVATGEGTVYVNADGNYSDDATGYGATSTGGNATPTSGGAVDVYMFAKPNEGYECVGWSTSATATSYESTSAQYTKSVIAATNGGEDRATTYDMYAYFKALPVFWFSAAASATLSGETATVDYKASDYGEHWNSASGTTLAKFTATRNTGYVFDGWSKTATGPIVSTDNPYYIQLESSSSTQAGATTVTYYARYSERIAPPTIAFSETATGFSVTLSHSLSDVIIYYSTDGSIPSATNGTQYGGSPFSVTSDLTTVKAVAVRNDVTSDVASTQLIRQTGTVGNSVILNDYEDHTWTYYAGVPATVDGGNYNTSYAGKIYSPNPRNVKITYNGVNDVTGSTNTVKVSASESETSFVYYKTLEESATSGQYSYQVISNPFSVRPSTGSGSSKVYYGFNGWKIVSGGEYIDGYSNGQTLPLDAKITFVSLPYPSVNCTSAEIVFQTTWTQATVRTSAPGTSDFTSGTYETNFWVLNGNQTSDVTLSKNMTISAQYPDGTQSGNYGFSSGITVSNTFAGTVKLEHLNLTGSSGINAGGRNLTIGRGIGGTSTRTIFGCNTQNTDVNQLLKVESGTYNAYYGYGYTTQYVLFVPVNTGIAPKSIVSQHTVFGNDYDRANSANTNLTISNNVYALYSSGSIGITDPTKLVTHITVKSGKFISDATTTNATFNNSFYMWDYSQDNNGLRILDIEGGEFGHIAGGANSTSSSDDVNKVINLKIRMRGGTVNGSIFGGAARYNASGSKQFVFTGGTVKGWIAGGSNGYESADEGSVTGSSYVYIGGNTQVNSNGDNTARNAGVGGTVYGAGCGQSATATSGRVALGTNVVVADNAYVERGVYGGGSFGYCPTDKTTNIYITGGEVGGNAGAISRSTSQVYAYSSYITGGVYGGACQNNGGAVNIYMTGGLVNGGLYGGSNVSGMINQNVKMVVTDGQVGTSSQPANIHGGGYGPATRVLGSVNLTIGAANATSGATIYGDVYGGSAEGKTNGNASLTTGAVTNVTLNVGTIHGSLYGGGLGNDDNAADVYGPVAVKVYGGSVKTTDGTGANGSGAVYGANNINGAPQRAVTVDIYGTDAAPEEGEYALFAVYGGGNHANYTYTEDNVYPKVTVHNCDNSIEYVYGGGNQATVPGTQVKVYGGNVIGNVFGGGNNANVTAKGTDVDIYGGAILNVFGGNNNGGAVTGAISVTVNAQAESGSTACTMALGNVYGGGNIAAYSVYGYNTDGTIKTSGDKLYADPVVNFANGTSTGSVFGGGKGQSAVVVGDPRVNIGDWNNAHEVAIGGSVFGGGDLAAVEGNPIVTIRNCGTTIGGDLYGGGNAAPVYSTNTTMWGGTVKGNVFGGGNGSDPTKNTNGAQVGYKSDDTTPGTGDGNAVTYIYGGTIGTWTTVGGVQTCTAGGGIFGGSNTNGNIRGAVTLTIDEQACTETDAEQCDLKMKEAYGAGNEAPFTGSGVTLNLGCITSMDEIYGGAKKADMKGDVNLRITNGHFGKVFGGNNISGKLDGKIVVTVDETGCNPVTIGALYGGGNLAPYSVYGYNTDGTVKTSGDKLYADPVVNVVSCTSIGTIFGGGKGESAKVVGNPTVNVNLIPGEHAASIDADGDDAADNDDDAIGTIGTIYGGGDAAPVVGSTLVNIGTATADQSHVTGTDLTTTYPVSVNITGNVFGAGYGTTATVSGDSKVVIGPKKN